MLLSVLTAAPFNLVLGNSIDVQIIATNIFGSSSVSVIGSGANIVVLPSAPINFSNVVSITLASRIGLSWSAGASGGSTIIDYQIYYDQSTNNWVSLASGITGLSYTTQTTLI